MAQKKTISKKPVPVQKQQDIEVSIRRADCTDAVKIYNILKKYIQHSLPNAPAPHPDDAIPWIVESIKTGLVLVADMGGTLIGSLAGSLAVWPHNRAVPYFHGQWFFVMPGYQEDKVNVALLRKARKLANLSQMDMLFMFFGAGAVDEKERLMLEEGFTDCGGALMMKAIRESDEPLTVQVRQ